MQWCIIRLYASITYLFVDNAHTQRQAAGLKIIEGSCAAGEHDSCYLAGTHYISPGKKEVTLLCYPICSFLVTLFI